MGVYDCCPGEENKMIRIKYKFQDRLHYAEFDDMEAISIPKRSHQMKKEKTQKNKKNKKNN